MAHLSSEDFTRLQDQLLELRQKNYTQEEKLSKTKKELVDTKARLQALGEENARYQILIRTTKKASEVELLIRDNGYLRTKLKDQEEDFRLQNNTLLKELSKLVAENERYEKQMEVLCGNRSCDAISDGDHGSTDDSKEVIMLRGELKELKERLYEAETCLETEKQAHMEKNSALNLQVMQLTNILQMHSIPLDEGEINLGRGEVSFKKLTIQDDDGLEIDVERRNVLEEKLSSLPDASQTQEHKKKMEKDVIEFQQKVSEQHLEIISLNEILKEQTKLAENEQHRVKEMEILMEERRQNWNQELERLSEQHKEEKALLISKNQQLKTNLKEVNLKMSEMTDLGMTVTQLEYEKLKMEESNRKLLEELKIAQQQVEKQTAEKIEEIKQMKYDWEKERNDLQTQLEISNIQRQEAEDTVELLKRKVADGEEEQKIHERKGVTLMKDLKKQLMAEQKRADRLQEKLSQLLSDPTQLTTITNVSEGGDDVSSVSSWSLVSGEPRDSSTRENSIIISPQGSPPPGIVTEETISLVNRLTELQQNKWQLEERIAHLESSSAAMANDLLKKSAVIQHFCIEKKHTDGCSHSSSSPMHPAADKLNVRRILEMMRGSGGEESLKEINRKLQQLLEETLGKNIQLQKDVENLTQQVHELSKLAAIDQQQIETETLSGL